MVMSVLNIFAILFFFLALQDIDIGAALVEKSFAVSVDSANQKPKPVGASNEGAAHTSQALPTNGTATNGDAQDSSNQNGNSSHQVLGS